MIAPRDYGDSTIRKKDQNSTDTGLRDYSSTSSEERKRKRVITPTLISKGCLKIEVFCF